MNIKKVAAVWAFALSAAVPSIVHAEVDWVSGDVLLVEDMRAHWPAEGILLNLGNKIYNSPGGAISTSCTGKFRIVANQENVTADIQKSLMTMALSARLSGDKVRVLVNSATVSNGVCTVRAISIGEF